MKSDTGGLAIIGDGADTARIRDIPRICVCEWHLDTVRMVWVRSGHREACPWHGHGGQR